MKIGIIGRHPELENGFNAVMSILFAKGLTTHGSIVTLYLPDSECHNVKALLHQFGIASLDNLNRYGSSFDIKITNIDGSGVDKNEDFIIWQSYRAQEDILRKTLKYKGFFIVKNPPRIFSGYTSKDKAKYQGLLKNYDFIAASLYTDFKESMKFGQDFIHYVPRGFDTSILVPDKPKYPMIGLDKSVKAQDSRDLSIRHIVNSGIKLQSLLPKTEYLSLRDNIKELNSKRIRLLGYPEFYEKFINKIWIYIPIDFDYSVHNKGKNILDNGTHRYVGLYENQVVETQLAGGLVVSRNGDIPQELVMMPDISYVDSYDSNEVFEILINQINNFEQYSAETRCKAIEKHDYLKTTKTLLDLVSLKLKS